MAQNIMDRVAAAKAEVPGVSVEEAMAMAGRDDVVIIDVRDHPEVAQTGKIAGARHVTRGMLEFKAQPGLPSHDPAITPDKTVLVYCASGGRAALAGKALKDMGYGDVRNLGGFADWAKAGGAVEPA